MDIRNALVAQNYAAGKAAVSADAGSGGQAFLGATQDFISTLRASEKTAMDAMTSGADPHALVQALAQTELAVQTAVTVRDKVVEAYQEILRMPV
jgi:flagellar hook-basal body complex protein FliE